MNEKRPPGRPWTATGSKARPVGTRIPPELHDRLVDYSLAVGESKASVVMRAIVEYLDRVDGAA